MMAELIRFNLLQIYNKVANSKISASPATIRVEPVARSPYACCRCDVGLYY